MFKKVINMIKDLWSWFFKDNNEPPDQIYPLW